METLDLTTEEVVSYIRAINMGIYSLNEMQLGDAYISSLCELNDKLITYQEKGCDGD